MLLAETTTGFSARLDSGGQWSLTGELDLLSAPDLLQFARSAPTPEVDLSVHVHDLTFIDAAGWRALREAHEIVGRNHPMRLVGAVPAVAIVVAIVGEP